MSEFKFTEAWMQRKLSCFFALGSVHYNIDGLYVFGWESDKLLQTKSGYYYEFEIKVSRADFKNDFKHKKDKHAILRYSFDKSQEYLPKYFELLEKHPSGWYRGHLESQKENYRIDRQPKPNYFYYAVPEGLILPDEVPEYAGLVYVNERGQIKIPKKAPCLHKDKISDGVLGLGEKFYYNMCKYRSEAHSLWESNEMWKQKLKAEVDSKGQSKTYAEMEEQLRYYESEITRLEKALETRDNIASREFRSRAKVRRALEAKIQKYEKGFNLFRFEDEILKGEEI